MRVLIVEDEAKMAALLRLIGDTDSKKSRRRMDLRFAELASLAERFGYEAKTRDDLTESVPERECAEKK